MVADKCLAQSLPFESRAPVSVFKPAKNRPNFENLFAFKKGFWYKTRLFVGGALCGATLLLKVAVDGAFQKQKLRSFFLPADQVGGNATPLTGFMQPPMPIILVAPLYYLELKS